MKTKLHFIITLFVLSFTSLSLAQPTLTDANCNPFAGDIFTVIVTSSVAPGNAGANQTWNLSSMSFSAMQTVTMSLAALTPSSGLYPNANVSYRDGDLTKFYKTNSNSLQYYGDYYYANSFVGTVVATYTNPIDYLHLPLNYNDSYTDAYSGSEAHTGGTPPTMISFGTTTITADGYGTLIVPTGTFTNAMRVHMTRYGRDSIPNNSFGSYYTVDEYNWYVPGTHYPVAGITIGGSGFYISNYPTGLNENNLESSSFELYPVPASETLNINFPQSQIDRFDLCIYNNIGQKLKTLRQVTPISGKFNVNVSDLPSGIYILQVNCEGNIPENKQFIISK